MYISLCSLLHIVIVKPKPLSPPRLLRPFGQGQIWIGGIPFLCGNTASPQFTARPGRLQLRCCEERVAS